MIWKTLLAYISGSIDEELLKRNEYLAQENRILRGHIEGRLLLTDAELGWLNFTMHGRVLVQRQMRARVMIVLEIATQNLAHVLLIEGDHMI